MLRRLPVYLLCDCSESMIGKPLEAVQAGIQSMVSRLKRDPHALETVFASVITFDSEARVVVPLTEIAKVRPPALGVHPGTALGAALDLVCDSMERDIVKNTPSQKGDYRPLVFILTDGRPTDAWEGPARRLRGMSPARASVCVIGCGDEADFSAASQITENCVRVEGLTPAAISELFVWLSASVRSQSVSASRQEPLDLEKAPLRGGMTILDRAGAQRRAGRPAVFLVTVCGKTRQNYLCRFKCDSDAGKYRPEPPAALPEDFFTARGAQGPQVNFQEILSLAPCPGCGNTHYTACPVCGAIHCVRLRQEEAVCPRCGSRGPLDFSASPESVSGSPG